MTYQLFFIKSNFLFSEVWLMLQVFFVSFFLNYLCWVYKKKSADFWENFH